MKIVTFSPYITGDPIFFELSIFQSIDKVHIFYILFFKRIYNFTICFLFINLFNDVSKGFLRFTYTSL